MKRIIYTIMAALLLAGITGCKDKLEVPGQDSMGGVETEYIVSAAEGSVEMPYFTGLNGSVRIINSAGWARLDSSEIPADGKIKVTYDANEGYPRMAQVEVAANSRTDILTVCQEGPLAYTLSFATPNVIINNQTNAYSFPITTNVDTDKLSYKLDFSTDEKWVTVTGIENGEVKITTTDSENPRVLRSATLTYSFVDGWGKVMTATMVMTQTGPSAAASAKTFDVIRALATTAETEISIPDGYIIQGIVVSDKSGGNAGDNEWVSLANSDYSPSATTIYFESMDGNYGFLLRTADASANTFAQWSKFYLYLDDAKIIKHTNPERYEITGLTVENFGQVSVVPEAERPVKEKTISQLTDQDIYTYVTLKDCEYAIRKGSLTPIFERFANKITSPATAAAKDVHNILKFPGLIRDKDGKSIYMLTNTTCTYRRDGSRLPYGSGKLSGVIVHEPLFTKAADTRETPKVDISLGKYQIRHQAYSDIAFAADRDESFSAVLAEFGMFNAGNDGYLHPTYGDATATLTHTYSGYQNSGQKNVHANTADCFSSLAYTYISSGNQTSKLIGCLDDQGNDCGNTFNVATNQYGIIAKKTGTGGISNSFWWDSGNSAPYAWEVAFSTKDITSDVLSLQVSVLNDGAATAYGPRDWEVLWSLNGTDWTKVQDSEYSVAQIAVNNGAFVFGSMAGYMPYNIDLPASDLCGQDNVYLRLQPASNTNTNGGAIANGSNGDEAISAIDYLAIRYNKQQ